MQMALPTKIGIGTATPNEQLEITGNFRLASSSIIKSGDSKFIHRSGSGGSNFFAGVNAGNAITTGYANTAVGENALKSITGNYSNTAIGVDAMTNTLGGQQYCCRRKCT